MIFQQHASADKPHVDIAHLLLIILVHIVLVFDLEDGKIEVFELINRLFHRFKLPLLFAAEIVVHKGLPFFFRIKNTQQMPFIPKCMRLLAGYLQILLIDLFRIIIDHF